MVLSRRNLFFYPLLIVESMKKSFTPFCKAFRGSWLFVARCCVGAHCRVVCVDGVFSSSKAMLFNGGRSGLSRCHFLPRVDRDGLSLSLSLLLEFFVHWVEILFLLTTRTLGCLDDDVTVEIKCINSTV